MHTVFFEFARGCPHGHARTQGEDFVYECRDGDSPRIYQEYKNQSALRGIRSSSYLSIRKRSPHSLKGTGSRRNSRVPDEPKTCSGNCARDSLDPPSHALCTWTSLGFTDFANAHLCSTAASHLEDMAVRRGHFKNAILIAKNLGRIQDFDCTVDGFDHCAPQVVQFGEAINREYAVDYNTAFFVFLAIDNKRLTVQMRVAIASQQL